MPFDETPPIRPEPNDPNHDPDRLQAAITAVMIVVASIQEDDTTSVCPQCFTANLIFNLTVQLAILRKGKELEIADKLMTAVTRGVQTAIMFEGDTLH